MLFVLKIKIELLGHDFCYRMAITSSFDQQNNMTGKQPLGMSYNKTKVNYCSQRPD